MANLYYKNESIVFCKTREPWGELSNFASGFPLVLDGIEYNSSEALYQCCRYPHRPDIQAKIVAEKTAYASKMVAKEFIKETCEDWECIRIEAMYLVLELKLEQHRETFGEVLRNTGDKPIVELSVKDSFWGAYPKGDTLVGENMLGELLMILRNNNFLLNKI